MISIELMFYLAVGLFGGIGAIRGWQKEVIAMAGLIGSIAFLHRFGPVVISIGDRVLPYISDSQSAGLQESFWIQFMFVTSIAFFSYQLIGSIAERASRRDLSRGFQNGVVGFVMGLINGYLLFGTLWSFLEYQIQGEEYVPVDPAISVFAPYIDRSANVSFMFENIIDYLPLAIFNPGVWLLIFFLSFFVVIIALV